MTRNTLRRPIAVLITVLMASAAGAAADEIVEYLKQGYSTVVFPDAPRGPPYELKDGALHMSQQSGVPIAPVRFWISKYFELRGWDRKRMPYPFGTIRAEFQDPIQVTEENFDEARERLAEALGISVAELRWLTYHREAATSLHYSRFTIPKPTFSSSS